MLEYKDLVQEVLRHNESERQALLEEIQQSLQPKAQNGASNGHTHQPEIESLTYIGKLDETGQPVVLVRGVDGLEKLLPRSPFAQQFSYDYSWGETGVGAGRMVLAHSLLEYQFDVATADAFVNKFAYDVIRTLPTIQNGSWATWQLFSQEVSQWLEKKRQEPPSEKEIWRAERADYLTEKYK